MSGPPPGSRGVWMLAPLPPYEGPTRCTHCVGARLLPDRYTFGDPAPRMLLVQAFCPLCQGCGRAEHDQCPPTDHYTDAEDLDDDDLDALPAQLCLSCRGRGWWVCQAFSNDTVAHLRVPCGCSESKLVRVG